MNYVNIKHIERDLVKLLKDQSLYPVIGAGFSSGCRTQNGMVPSGTLLKKEMINQIKKIEKDISKISDSDLKTISKYYKKIVPRDIRTRYLRDNFTNVLLPEYSINFLKINWKYIYTFNIDTCIEDNSEYKNVILPNKPVDESIIREMDNCIFKVHGDADDYCKYTNSSCYIFDNKEYAQSIKNNAFILNKINHDFTYNNLMFIGCSLTDEFDLLSMPINSNVPTKTSRYYVTDTKPDLFKEIDLEQYGITDVILINDYKEFYDQMYNIFLNSQKLQNDELDKFRNIKINFLNQDYEENINYLCFGKSLYDSSKYLLNLPNFFIDRNIVIKKIIPEMNKYNIQFICGGRVSGKTYALASIVKNIRDRDVYFFDSRYSLSNNTIDNILSKEKSVLCFDTTSISKEQIYNLKDKIDVLYKNQLNVIICINRSDKDIISSIKKICGDKNIYIYDLNNKFEDNENHSLNMKFAPLSIPGFDIKKSLLDNLLIVSKHSNLSYKAMKFKFEIKDVYTMKILILLAIREKLSSQEFVDFGIEREVYVLLHKLSPIIDEDYTNIIERDSMNSSTYKIYANSRYWLLNKLGTYASDSSKHKLIIDAYYEIIENLIKNHSIEYKIIEDYIKYDIINEIFFRPDRGNLLLIKSLYDGLNDLLSFNPQFFHQKAKCYLWHCNYSSDPKPEIKDALRFAKLAKHDTQLKYNKNNPKVIISLAHIDFTLALIYAKYNNIANYENSKLFKESLPVIKAALESPYNREYFLRLIQRNNKKINDINNLFNYVTTSKDLLSLNLSKVEKNQLDDIINIIFSAKINQY